MSFDICISGGTAEQALADFAVLAKALNFTPQAEAIAYGQQLAVELCKQAGVNVQIGGAAPAAAEDTGKVVAAGGGRPTEVFTSETAEVEEAKPIDGEVIPPVEKPTRKTRTKPTLVEATGVDTSKTTLNDASLFGEEPAAAEAKDDAPMFTHDDARAALRALAAAKDMPTCSALLKEFGAAKAAEVPVEKIAAFVAKATELAGA